jgi:hypothetical protein
MRSRLAELLRRARPRFFTVDGILCIWINRPKIWTKCRLFRTEAFIESLRDDRQASRVSETSGSARAPTNKGWRTPRRADLRPRRALSIEYVWSADPRVRTVQPPKGTQYSGTGMAVELTPTGKAGQPVANFSDWKAFSLGQFGGR